MLFLVIMSVLDNLDLIDTHACGMTVDRYVFMVLVVGWCTS